jgi:hypothetical protein
MPGDKPEDKPDVVNTVTPTAPGPSQESTAPKPTPKGGKKDDDEATKGQDNAPKKDEPKKDEPTGKKKDDEGLTETQKIAKFLDKIKDDVNELTGVNKLLNNTNKTMKPGDDPLADGFSDEDLNEVDPQELQRLEGHHSGSGLEAPGGTKKDPKAALEGTDMSMGETQVVDEVVDDSLVEDLGSSMQNN